MMLLMMLMKMMIMFDLVIFKYVRPKTGRTVE